MNELSTNFNIEQDSFYIWQHFLKAPNTLEVSAARFNPLDPTNLTQPEVSLYIMYLPLSPTVYIQYTVYIEKNYKTHHITRDRLCISVAVSHNP